MRKGFKEKLRPSDVYQAPSQDAADILAERLEKLVFACLPLPLWFKMFFKTDMSIQLITVHTRVSCSVISNYTQFLTCIRI